jgi:hypothetical protein
MEAVHIPGIGTLADSTGVGIASLRKLYQPVGTCTGRMHELHTQDVINSSLCSLESQSAQVNPSLARLERTAAYCFVTSLAINII